MVGEIRDQETADIAIHASLTGHLVLSTLHTNDAPASITRLIDMGIQAYQISSSLLAVLAQRLVRRLCRHCRVPYRPSAADFLELGLDTTSNFDATVRELQAVAATTVIGNEEVGATMRRGDGASDLTFYKPLEEGCEECSHTGYRGRVGIFELMIVDEAVRREIVAGSDAKTIQRAARKQGMRLLREDGARQVIAGVTSVDEVIAATQAGEVE
jgi:general secretion pathway protein E